MVFIAAEASADTMGMSSAGSLIKTFMQMVQSDLIWGEKSNYMPDGY